MPFHAPIDRAQWEQARAMYQKMRGNIRQLKKTHSPRTPAEAELFNDYQHAVRKFGEQLLKPYGKINSDKLDALVKESLQAFVIYSGVYDSDAGDH